VVKGNMEHRPAQNGEVGVIEILRNGSPAGVLIVSGRVDSWRGSKWVENDREIDLLVYSRTYCAIVEIKRTCEKVRLQRVIEEASKCEIARRLVTMRDPRSRRKCVGVEKPRIRDPVNCRFVNSTVVGSGEIRNCPRADARGFWDSRCLLMNVVIPNRTNIDFWIEHPSAQREAFLVLTGGSDLLCNGARDNAHEHCHGYHSRPK